tara:strand:- start:329 stop:436 length:108 start_codon:yes stop_codon:yes gene_type:complete
VYSIRLGRAWVLFMEDAMAAHGHPGGREAPKKKNG